MKHIAIIYHDADFDGILSNEVCRYWLAKLYPDAVVHSYGWDYGRPVPIPDVGYPEEGTVHPDDPRAVASQVMEWRFWDQIYIVDLSVDELMARPELRDKIVWIDHHKSAIEKWDVPDLNEHLGITKQHKFIGYRIDGVAACRLCWQWLASENGPHGDPRIHAADVYLPTLKNFVDRAVSEPELLRLAGEYDIWDHRDPDAKALQFGLRSLTPVAFSNLVCDQFDGACTGSESKQISAAQRLRSAIADGYLIKNYTDKERAKYAQKAAYTVRFEGLMFCALNSTGNSESVQPAAELHHDALLLWRYVDQKVLVSLYHAEGKEHYDLSLIAKKYGGGGHRGACGFTLTIGRFIEAGLHVNVHTSSTPAV